MHGSTRTTDDQEPTGADQIDRKRPRRRLRPREVTLGQATIEFAIVSVAFLLVVFGTVDFGRAVYLKAQLDNAVREATRDLKTRTASGLAANNCGSITNSEALYIIKNMKGPEASGACKQGMHPRPGLQTATASVSCSPSCTSGGTLTVHAYLNFTAITQEFLGISPITLHSQSTAILE
jgi:Flp pilus assembly protein TadG